MEKGSFVIKTVRGTRKLSAPDYSAPLTMPRATSALRQNWLRSCQALVRRAHFTVYPGRSRSQTHYGVARDERSQLEHGMTLDVNEFIRRFLIHVLPGRLHRIRHYGLFANANRATKTPSGTPALAAAGV